jgi:hypothetical protein
MRRTSLALVSVLALGVSPALAQPTPGAPTAAKQEPTPIPVEAALADIKAAYAGITAEEITVKIKTPQGSERTDRMTVRLDGGADGRPRRLMLEMGTLRIALADGHLVAANTSAPSKCYKRDYAGPLNAEVVRAVLPPLPLPELDLLGEGLAVLRNPTPYTPGVSWTSATAMPSARPPTMTLAGSFPSGTVSLTAMVNSARLVRLTGVIKARDGETTLDLAFRPVEPGDPATWTVGTEGCEAVGSLAELRPPARPVGPIQPGQPVPEMAFTKPDMTAWTLSGALDAGRPLALVLYRGGGTPERSTAAATDARSALSLLRALRQGRPLPGETETPPPLEFSTAAAIAIELGEFSPAKWEESQRGWGAITRARTPASAIEADDLMWASSAAQTIERFVPGANAVAVVINPDRSLKGVVKLDGRAAEGEAVGSELRALLKSPP